MPNLDPDYTEFYSRIYVSTEIESVQGQAAALDRSFYVRQCLLNFGETYEKDPTVNGFLNQLGITRDSKRASGLLGGYLAPDMVAWAFKMACGASPVSTLVTPSTSVREHVFNAITHPPATFTFMKQLAAIPNYTEKWSGNGITKLVIRSGSEQVSMEVHVGALGAQYQQRVAEPNITPVRAGEDYLLGVSSQLLIDGTRLPVGLFGSGWTITIEPGQDVLDTGGSSDGSATRFDLTTERRLTASFDLYETSTVYMAEFLAGAFHSYEFQVPGPVIDPVTGLTSLVSVMLSRARIVNNFRSEITGQGIYRIPLVLEGVIDQSTGFDHVVRIRNLQPGY